jgi:hypothetical protein
VVPLCIRGKKKVRRGNGFNIRSGAGQAHPKGPGPVSSELDIGGLTGGIKDNRKIGGKAPPKWEPRVLVVGDISY